eukprot:8166237-Alexandrium_andersonii.AAC.1
MLPDELEPGVQVVRRAHLAGGLGDDAGDEGAPPELHAPPICSSMNWSAFFVFFLLAPHMTSWPCPRIKGVTRPPLTPASVM